MPYPASFLNPLPLDQFLCQFPWEQPRDRYPPYMPTLALLHALLQAGYPCQLWNAILNSPRERRVIAGIYKDGAIRDIAGMDPRHYPAHYPLFEQGVLLNEKHEPLIDGKMEHAAAQYPYIAMLCEQTLEKLWLAQATDLPAGDKVARRL